MYICSTYLCDEYFLQLVLLFNEQAGLTPLMEAAIGGFVEIGRILLDAGADLNPPPTPTSRDTPLTYAAEKGHAQFVRMLLEAAAQDEQSGRAGGINLEARNKKGCTALWLAAAGAFSSLMLCNLCTELIHHQLCSLGDL